MRPHIKILVATLAAIPFAATAQMYGGAGQPKQSAPPAAQQSDQLKPAKESDIKAGASVSDSKGAAVGKIDSVDAEGAVIAVGSERMKVPLSSLGVGSKGLTLSVTKAELEAAAAKKKEEKPK